MPTSKNRKTHTVKKKKYNYNKQKIKEMANTQEQAARKQPVTYTYDPDNQTVTVPMKAWQTLNQVAASLQDIAMFVTTMELVGQQHMTDGTLIPVFEEDTEPTGVKLPNGEDQKKIKADFFTKRKSRIVTGLETTSIIVADGKEIFNAANKPA